jgi:hypothetical protein
MLRVESLKFTLLAVLCACGCAGKNPCPSGCVPYYCGPEEPPSEVRLTARGRLSTDVVGLHPPGRSTEPVIVAPQQYRSLTDAEVQCLAAAHAPVANLLEMENNLSLRADQNWCCGDGRKSQLTRQVRSYRILDERNKSAATALERFYQLVEAEYQRDAIDRSLQKADRALADLERLRQQGLPLPPDPTALVRQRLILADRLAQLELNLLQLQGDLRRHLGTAADPPLWPTADLTIDWTAVNADAAVETGLAYRPDLAIVRLLRASLDRETLPIIRVALQHKDSTLGIPPGRQSPLCRMLKPHLEEELATRRGQLRRLYNEQAQAAELEIRSAAQSVESSLHQVAAAKETLESRQQRLRQMRELLELGKATSFEVLAAEVDELQADGELLHQIVALRIAQVKLKAAQGLLAIECGFSGPCGHGRLRQPPQSDDRPAEGVPGEFEPAPPPPSIPPDAPPAPPEPNVAGRVSTSHTPQALPAVPTSPRMARRYQSPSAPQGSSDRPRQQAAAGRPISSSAAASKSAGSAGRASSASEPDQGPASSPTPSYQLHPGKDASIWRLADPNPGTLE